MFERDNTKAWVRITVVAVLLIIQVSIVVNAFF